MKESNNMETKSRNIFLCFNPFHCITATIIKRMIGNESINDIIVADNFDDAEIVAKNIRESGEFNDTFFARNYQKVRRNPVLNISPKVTLLFLELGEVKKNKYDRIFTNLIAECIGDALTYFNKDVKAELFDEGYSSYMKGYFSSYKNFSIGHKIIEKISAIIYKRKFLRNLIDTFYLYDPRLLLYNPGVNIQKILTDKLDDSFIQSVSKFFSVEDALDNYKVQYIFFEESFGNEYNDSGDMVLINDIADEVGKENLLIKLHPRDHTDRFQKRGYCTNENKFVPWEAIAIAANGDMNQKLISFTSGAALNFHFIVNKKIMTILLYKLDSENYSHLTTEKERWLKQFHEYYGEKIFIPETKEELISFLRTKY